MLPTSPDRQKRREQPGGTDTREVVIPPLGLGGILYSARRVGSCDLRARKRIEPSRIPSFLKTCGKSIAYAVMKFRSTN